MKKLVDNLRLLLLIGLIVGLVAPTLVLAAESYTQYEYWNTADDAAVTINGSIRIGQTFTTGSTIPHTITQVRLKLFRVLSPGILTVYIYETSGGQPTGLPIGEGTISGDALTTDTGGTWYSVTLDEEVTLETGTQYAVVSAALSGNATNYVSWRYDNANGYADGYEVSSTDGGISWTTVGANDMMFEIWGNPVMKVLGVKVFSNFLESGDQLFVFPYKVLIGEDYITDNPQDYFHMQLLVGSTVEAQGKLPAWGYKPGSIYLDADEALPWATNQTKIKLTGTTGSVFDGDTTEYILIGEDWVGDDPTQLEDWVITLAKALEKFYDVTLVVAGEPRGMYLIGSVQDMIFGRRAQLNEDGTSIFVVGIPGLVSTLPELFEGIIVIPEEGLTPPVPTYQDTLTGNLGQRATAAFVDIGNLLGVSGLFLSGVFWFWIVIIGIAVLGVGTGHMGIGLITALPLVFAGAFMGIIPLVWILLPTFLFAAYVFAKWFKVI